MPLIRVRGIDTFDTFDSSTWETHAFNSSTREKETGSNRAMWRETGTGSTPFQPEDIVEV